MRECDQTLGLNGFACRDDVGPRLRLGDAGIGEDLGVVEQPVLSMDIDRQGVEVAVAHRSIEDGLRQSIFPMAGIRLGIEVDQEAAVDEFVELLAGVELHHGRRIAADDAIDTRRPRSLAPGDRRVDPLATGLVEGVREHLHGGGFAARRPPMNDFRLHGIGRSRGAGSQRARNGQR